MTPEEILAECPEYFVLDWVRKSPTIYKERGTGRDVNPKEVEKIATSRKEARELREQFEKFIVAASFGCKCEINYTCTTCKAIQKYRSTQNV